MGAHKQNPRAIAKASGQAIPFAVSKEIVGVKIEARRRPKPHVRVVPKDQVVDQDGKRYLLGPGGAIEPVPEGQVVFYEGEEVAPDQAGLLDLVFEVYGVYAEPSALSGPDGNMRGAGIMICELARVDLDDFRRRGRAAIAGGTNVPGFNEQSEPWWPTQETSL